MRSVKYKLEEFDNHSFKKKTDLIFSTGARLSAKFYKGHLFELYSMGVFFAQVRYTRNKPDKVHTFFANNKRVDFFILDELEKEKV